MNSFKSLNLKSELIQSLKAQGFINMSEVQEKSIPALLRNESIIVKSETGSGKTLSFLVPILNDLTSDELPQAIIVAPTNMLANQICSVLKSFVESGYNFSYSFVDSLNRTNYGKIIVTTPVFVPVIKQYCNLKKLKRIILDEADMLIFGGFEEEITSIIQAFKAVKISLFTASIDEHLSSFIKKYIGAYDYIDVTKKKVTSQSVKHHLVNVHSFSFEGALITFLKVRKPFKCIIFSSKKTELVILHEALTKEKISHAYLTGDMPKGKQKQEIRRFKDGEVYYLLASDIASRGIDVIDVTDVISMNIPYEQIYYFHRAGRAGRFSNGGDSYLFYDSDDVKKVKELQKKVKFDYYTLKKDQLKAERDLSTRNQKKHTNELLEKQIRKEVAKVRSNVVKPNYKKKIKKAAEKAKRYHRMKIIRKNLAKKDKSIN